MVDIIQRHLATYEPATESQKALQADAYREFSQLVQLRRSRLRSVIAELPMPLWSVLLIGTFVNIAVTWFFHMRSRKMHFWMTVMFSGTLGLMIYLVADLDHPFRGHVSVGPDAFKMVYEQLMKPGK